MKLIRHVRHSAFSSTLILTALLTLTACDPPPEIISHTPLVKYEIAQAVDDQQRRSLSGIVQAAQSSTLSFQVSGKIASVNVNNGSQVKRGDVLAALEQRDYQLDLNKAQADLAAKQSDFNERKSNLARNETLLQQGTISKVQYISEQTAFDNAASALKIAEIQLENARKDLADTQLIAPFDGVISSRQIEPFTEITVGKDALIIDSPNELEVKVLVPETLVRKIYYGQEVEVRFPTIKEAVVLGTVSEIGSQVETGNAFPVKVTLNKSQLDVRTGMTASATFLLRKKNRLIYLVPISAFAINESSLGMVRYQPATLYIVDPKSSTLQKRQVQLGGPVGDRIEVDSGLNEGDIVIVAGVPFLAEGMTVKLWEPNNG